MTPSPSPPSAPEATPTLQHLGRQQALLPYLKAVWSRREFVWNIAVGNLRAQHMDTVLGNIWHVLNPLLLLGVYYVVFGLLIPRGASEGIDNFIGFLAVGIFVYNFCQRSISSGASSIVKNVGLIRSLQFPRMVLPLATVVQSLMTFGTGALVMLVLLLVTGERPDAGWLMLIPVTALATLLGVGGALITSRLTDRVRDIENVLPYIFRLTFYMSGILYSVDRVIEVHGFDSRLKSLFLLNPFYDLIEIARHYLMSSYDAERVGLMWLALLGFVSFTVLFGIFYFRGGEGTYGRG